MLAFGKLSIHVSIIYYTCARSFTLAHLHGLVPLGEGPRGVAQDGVKVAPGLGAQRVAWRGARMSARLALQCSDSSDVTALCLAGLKCSDSMTQQVAARRRGIW